MKRTSKIDGPYSPKRIELVAELLDEARARTESILGAPVRVELDIEWADGGRVKLQDRQEATE